MLDAELTTTDKLQVRVAELEALVARQSEELKRAHENDAQLTTLLDNVRDQEQRLQRSEQFYKSILEDLADVTTILRPDGALLWVSASVGSAWSVGFKPELLVGRNTMDLIHPDDREKVRAAIARDLAGC
jgi:PAS domain-containing protein